MLIKCWGSRGSIPISGAEYIKYGGDTTCLEIRTKSDDVIIVDAGTGIRRLGKSLIDENRYKYSLLFTHSHWDHLLGFPFFKPLYEKEAEFKMYRCPFHSKFVETILSSIMNPPSFPVKYSEISAKIKYMELSSGAFDIGSVTITPIPISHPDKGSGYKFTEDGKSFVFLTDNELGFIHPGGLPARDYLEFSRDADLLIHDAEYTPEEYPSKIEWGHSVFTETLDLAIRAGVKQFGLFHLNQERTDQQVEHMVKICKEIIAEKNHPLDCFAVGRDMTFTI